MDFFHIPRLPPPLTYTYLYKRKYFVSVGGTGLTGATYGIHKQLSCSRNDRIIVEASNYWLFGGGVFFFCVKYITF